MAGKPKIGEDPLWWIQADPEKKQRKGPVKGKTAGKPEPEWVRTVLELRARYNETLNRMAKREGVPLRKLVDRILAAALHDEPKSQSKKRSGRETG